MMDQVNQRQFGRYPSFIFKLSDSQVMSFQEVSGLDIQSEEIKYRHGDSPQFSVIKMPGMKKFGNVTMKKRHL